MIKWAAAGIFTAGLLVLLPTIPGAEGFHRFSAPADRSGSASGIAATARLTGDSIGAALAAFGYGLIGTGGATLAPVLAAVLSALTVE
jgi:hypothetical protein